MSKKANEGEGRGRDRDGKGKEGREEEKWKGGGEQRVHSRRATRYLIFYI